jgi:hypothetical protein
MSASFLSETPPPILFSGIAKFFCVIYLFIWQFGFVNKEKLITMVHGFSSLAVKAV